MDKEENSSSGQGKNQPDPKGAETTQNVKNKVESQTKSSTKPRGKRKSKIKPELLITLITALITAITSIVVALITAHGDTPSPTPTFSLTHTSVPTQRLTDIPVSYTDMPLPTGLPSWTNTPTASLVPTAALTETVTLVPRPKLIVRLDVNQTSGRKPLTVKLDARQSYLTEYDGQTYVCRNGACYYTWKVYSNGQQTGKSVTDSGGTFDYTFGKQGTYMITVWVCRGRDGVDCGGSGAQIVVTK